MIPQSLRIIREDHQALARVLHAMARQLAELRRTQALPDFTAWRAILFYLDEFPERLHHPKESDLLFPKLRSRAPLLRDTLDELEQEHQRGGRAIRDLSHALLAFEMIGEARRHDFEALAERYCAGYLHHIATEENEILPVAQQVLNTDDWQELDSAFARNCDPLTGHPAGETYQALFQKILQATQG
ncbi:MAG: hemerythrin domain-containing protein [Burkholderiaceae bacterium]|nr:hemerythrin domain-containing protein [Roseateles sp.]MBV8470120.1 hemerythrin domain-containing protein [Burkholderiaceae bacterium]